MKVTTSTTYLITGANRGLGIALVEAYLTRPHSTVIAAVRDPSSSSSKNLATLPRSSTSRLIVVKIESTSPTDADDAIATLEHTHGITALDVVIANAGMANAYPVVHEASPKSMLEHFTVNVVGVVVLFRAVRPLLLRAAATSTSARTPKFITMSSRAGSIGAQDRIPVPNAAYGPSKAALNWITVKIHLENKDLGLCSFAMHPGWVQTEMGNAGAREFGLEKAQIMLEESIPGMVDVIDNATMDATAGKFMVYDGTEWAW
ncbi:hypothetical protein G647_09584 [Cladophialophora carrionii CBS 160.54]|uniref:Uncharacterized protein n=1 Tax=Cladophialophora carrionii CBS 160.54 TaxID=1279043 RepID=V9DKH9_9EURO|nr:uncharacterized protein G647_09584 [Cladophialophora carrionii CBS 160.54]ETI27394.1 hypothetical protein G647_09584 [Cladophialophora carrionii CBS 160.54]